MGCKDIRKSDSNKLLVKYAKSTVSWRFNNRFVACVWVIFNICLSELSGNPETMRWNQIQVIFPILLK